MATDRFTATYLIETPLDPRKVAEVMAGEQSSGTFTRVAGETDELRDRTGPGVKVVDNLAAGQLREIPGNGIQLVRLPGIGLVERLWPDAERQLLHCLTDCRLTLVQNALLITDRIIQLIVDDAHNGSVMMLAVPLASRVF